VILDGRHPGGEAAAEKAGDDPGAGARGRAYPSLGILLLPSLLLKRMVVRGVPRRPCSYSLYLDAVNSPAKASVESSCPLLVQSQIIEPRGGYVRWEGVVELQEGVLVAPYGALLPSPPGYIVVDTLVVVDSEPGFEFYGLPHRHVTVIASTQRTVMEAAWYPQLVVASRAAVLDEKSAYIEPRLAAALAWPMVSGLPALDEVLLCEARRGLGLAEWAWCLERLGDPSAAVPLAAAAKLGPHAAARSFAALLVRSGLPLKPLKAPPAVLRGDKLVVAAEHVTIGLRRSGLEEWRTVHRGETRLHGWDEVALLCKWCWHPIPRL